MDLGDGLEAGDCAFETHTNAKRSNRAVNVVLLFICFLRTRHARRRALSDYLKKTGLDRDP